MTDTGQTLSHTSAQASTLARRQLDDDPLIEVIPTVRLVQPGSWLPCMRCRLAIEFAPGAARSLVVAGTYEDKVLQSVELFHVDCYDAPS